MEFHLPEVSEGVETAEVAAIHVSEGDVIEADQVVMELETEKAVVDLPCPHAGKVTKIHVSVGDTVPIGASLLTIAPAEETEPQQPPQEPAPEKPPAEAETASAEEPAPEQPEEQPEPREAAPKEPSKQEPSPAEVPRAIPSPTEVATAPWSAALHRIREDGRQGPPVPAGPATRRMARKLGVDLRQVEGSGRGGRVTRQDVEAYVRRRVSGAAPETEVSPAEATLPDFSKFGPVERQPLNKLAKTSSAHLSLAWRVAPHVTQHDLADVTELEAARKRYMKTIGQDGPKITMTVLVVKAVVEVLKAFPHVNSSFDAQSNELILKRYYHVGVAVDTEAGLLVPVIHDVDQKSIIELAGELTELSEKARNRKLALGDMEGGTFTVTNLGGIGGTAFTPIINYPEVAILGMSRTQKQVMMQDGQTVQRLMLPLSLSYDHRVINGADAARFVVQLSQILSDVFQMLVAC